MLADTHVRPGHAGRLPDAVYDALAHTDVILHAGDVVTRDLLDELEAFAPVHAVLGNNDDAGLVAALPETLELELGGVKVAMIHDSGATARREQRMRRRFPSAQLVIFGHSHVPFDHLGLDEQRLFNPGSPTQRRRAPFRTFGRLRLDDGRIVEHSIESTEPVEAP